MDRKITAVIVSVCILFSVNSVSVLAEDNEEYNVYHVINRMTEEGMWISEEACDENEEVGIITRFMGRCLAEAIMNLGVVEIERGIPEDEEVVSNIEENMQEGMTTYTIFETGRIRVESIEKACQYSIKYNDSHFEMKESVFNQEGELQRINKLEIGNVNNGTEKMALYIGYCENGPLSYTERFLVEKKGEAPARTLYAQTFGKILDVKIDLQDWSRGVQYDWDNDLLFPVEE